MQKARRIFRSAGSPVSDIVYDERYTSGDLGEPFDFLTWFEFAPEHEAAFDEQVALLRAREEWVYVDREVDVRLSR